MRNLPIVTFVLKLLGALRQYESREVLFMGTFEAFALIAVVHGVVHSDPAYVSRATITTFDVVAIAISLSALFILLVDASIHQHLLERAKTRPQTAVA